MKFEIQNLGPIKNAEIELKPLTIFIGPNNTGKTWVSALIYEILNPIGFGYGHHDMKTILYNLNETGTAELDFYGYVVSQIKNNNFYPVDETTFEWIFLIDKTFFKDSWFITHLTKNVENEINIEINKIEFTEELKIGDIIVIVEKKCNTTKIKFSTFQKNKNINEKEFSDKTNRFLGLKSHNVFNKVFPKGIFFPAQRTSLLLTYKDYFVIRSNNDETRNKGSKYPLYIGDYYNKIIYFNNKQKSKFGFIADKIEKEVIRGKILIERALPELPPEFLFEFSPTEKPLPIIAAATGVQQLTFFVAWLRYEAKENDLIFIDEPEINLHPQAQVKLAEAFAMMVNAGLKLVISTHTPYIIDHLNNLLACERVARKKEKKIKDIRKQMSDKLKISENCWLKPEDVAAYHFHQEVENDPTSPVVVENIFSKKSAEIQWHSFSKVSEVIDDLFDIILDFEYFEDILNQKK